MPNPPVQASAEKTLYRELESDTDRVAVSLEETLKTHVEHCSSLKAAIERLSGAIETFKPPPQSDKETTFWTAYKTLSDEFDKEFQRKYANDLDTSLIFAGLFSAVTSAFILQIQPELLPDPTPALSTAPLQIESGPRTIIVVAQSLLYFSLFSTLFAALLAVLGKQWLLHYDSVGERGTLEERGLERQRKFDGLRRWKFEPIMQIFPLLLQFSLLLFATALSIYLWTIHHAIAAIVFGFTSLGCVLYTLMVVAALASPDSPFQTSLTTILRALLKIIPIPRSLRRFARKTRRRAHRGIATFFRPLSLVYTGFTETIQPLLPRFRTKEEDFELKSPGGRIFDNIQEPSQQISAVQWALETSTDPRMVEAAAAMVSDLQWQWPVDIDLRPSLKRLLDIFRGCFEGECVREGMGNRASSCVKAFGLLRIIADEQVNKEFRWLDLANDRSHPLNGSSVIAFARVQCESASETLSWNLRFISAQQYHAFHLDDFLEWFCPETDLDASLLADFLFCVNSFFVRPNVHDLILMDKREYCADLTAALLANLTNGLRNDTVSNDTAGAIVEWIMAFKENLQKQYYPGTRHSCRRAAYTLCAKVDSFLATSVLRVVRLNWTDLSKSDAALHLQNEDAGTPDIAWVYSALEELDILHSSDVDIIGDLLQVLFDHGPSLPMPTTACLRTILRGIPFGAGNQRMRLLASNIICSATHWFRDNELRPILREHSVWAALGELLYVQSRALLHLQSIPDELASFIDLGDNLSQTMDWKLTMSDDITVWLSHLPYLYDLSKRSEDQFCSVLSRVWNVDAMEGQQFGDEKPLAMAFTALATVWSQSDLSNPQGFRRLLALIECTISTAFCARRNKRRLTTFNPSRRFKDIVMVCLGDALALAAQRLRAANAATANNVQDLDQELLKKFVENTADLLSRLASTVNGKLKKKMPDDYGYRNPAEVAYYWDSSQQVLYDDLEALRQAFKETSMTRG